MNSARRIAVIAIAVLTPAAYAQQVKDPAAAVADFEKPAWNEQKIQLPKSSKPVDLIKFDAGPAREFEFFVDGASLSVGEDGVVRFTMVVKSDSATNVSYEGIRCETAERKTYAYGRADGTWYEPKDPSWAKVRNQLADRHRFALYQDFFCPARTSIKTAVEGRDALKRGGHPRALDLNTGFPIPR